MTELTTTPVSSRRWVSLAASCAAAGMVWLAFADLGVAIPTIADEFQADLSTLQCLGAAPAAHERLRAGAGWLFLGCERGVSALGTL
jgi:hypothetical protein